ncbi:hypothetical protein [Moorena sp. SIO3I6]|uniref:hypothetical protein n=1 Tax=Moorena sp. SIO3I6 TaxID=2607831 RepID=UPI0013FB3486|nr:hypothetical protein [Moorena sp. SIO3I6]NEP27391.1 hypothetical protein [Moorena sp. SIO3I6]
MWRLCLSYQLSAISYQLSAYALRARCANSLWVRSRQLLSTVPCSLFPVPDFCKKSHVFVDQQYLDLSSAVFVVAYTIEIGQGLGLTTT